jgi:hypothetical protein
MTAYGPKRRTSMSAPMSAVGELSGLNMLALSLAADDPFRRCQVRRYPEMTDTGP